MNVFLSWSGTQSKAVAEALYSWLPKVLQAVRPWMSVADIDKGTRWSTDIAVQLGGAKFGIICLTPDNREAPWVLFEAGALAKTLEKTYVCPYLFRLEPADLKGPLVQFQSTRAEKDDTRKLIHTINSALDDGALQESPLDEAFEMWWPRLEESLRRAASLKDTPRPQRKERELLEEILQIVRDLSRTNKFRLRRPTGVPGSGAPDQRSLADILRAASPEGTSPGEIARAFTEYALKQKKKST
jgi:hypothetical protein